jgi:hypothetical protein
VAFYFIPALLKNTEYSENFDFHGMTWPFSQILKVFWQ